MIYYNLFPVRNKIIGLFNRNLINHFMSHRKKMVQGHFPPGRSEFTPAEHLIFEGGGSQSQIFGKKMVAWWFKVTFLGWLSDPLKGLSDLQLGDEKVTNWITWWHFFLKSPWISLDLPGKIDMEQNHRGLEDHFSFLKWWFVGSMLIFQCVTITHICAEWDWSIFSFMNTIKMCSSIYEGKYFIHGAYGISWVS